MANILWQHDKATVLGVWTKLYEDDKGLYGEGQLLINDVAKAKEAHALLKHGAIDGLSIGYYVKEYSIDNEQFLSRLCGGEDTKPVPVIDALVSKPPVWRGRGG